MVADEVRVRQVGRTGLEGIERGFIHEIDKLEQDLALADVLRDADFVVQDGFSIVAHGDHEAQGLIDELVRRSRIHLEQDDVTEDRTARVSLCGVVGEDGLTGRAGDFGHDGPFGLEWMTYLGART